MRGNEGIKENYDSSTYVMLRGDKRGEGSSAIPLNYSIHTPYKYAEMIFLIF